MEIVLNAPENGFKRESRRSDHKMLNDSNINFPVKRKATKTGKGSRERMILESIFQIAKALTLRLKWHSAFLSIIYHYRDARRSDIHSVFPLSRSTDMKY